jgi:hypothetical protein
MVGVRVRVRGAKSLYFSSDTMMHVCQLQRTRSA